MLWTDAGGPIIWVSSYILNKRLNLNSALGTLMGKLAVKGRQGTISISMIETVFDLYQSIGDRKWENKNKF